MECIMRLQIGVAGVDVGSRAQLRRKLGCTTMVIVGGGGVERAEGAERMGAIIGRPSFA
jgi:hypothetical protein